MVPIGSNTVPQTLFQGENAEIQPNNGNLVCFLEFQRFAAFGFQGLTEVS
jgi:hypothetical protein